MQKRISKYNTLYYYYMQEPIFLYQQNPVKKEEEWNENAHYIQIKYNQLHVQTWQ